MLQLKSDQNHLNQVPSLFHSSDERQMDPGASYNRFARNLQAKISECLSINLRLPRYQRKWGTMSVGRSSWSLA